MGITTILSPKFLKRDYGTAVFHEHWCPGCGTTHQVAIDNPFRNGARWSWDGNAQAPTLAPSVNCEPDNPQHHCHYFLRAGRIEYQGDCHHALAGKTVDLPDIPANWLD